MGNLVSVGKSAPTIINREYADWHRILLVLLIISTGITFVFITRGYAPYPELQQLCMSLDLLQQRSFTSGQDTHTHAVKCV
jgi:hypothetical protein